MVGAGYSNAQKLSLSASIRQDNFLGSGNFLAAELNTSQTNRSMVFSTTNPYFTVDGISRALDLYYRTSRPLNSIGDEYQLATPGAGVRFGVPFSDRDTVFFGIGIERVEIHASSGIPNSYYLYRPLYGPNSNALPLTLGWQRDDRDSVLTPTSVQLLAREDLGRCYGALILSPVICGPRSRARNSSALHRTAR